MQLTNLLLGLAFSVIFFGLALSIDIFFSDLPNYIIDILKLGLYFLAFVSFGIGLLER